MEGAPLHSDVPKMRIQSEKKLRWLQVQCADDALHVGQRDVAFTALHSTHVAAIQAAVLGESFLRKPSFFA